MASSSGSSKRAKAPGNVAQVAQCSVDGCRADLSLCREYHRRHKVCETHSKTAKVTIGGREQRFCQQCSRFHSLVEFDDGKRSCRKRLDGHNRRRRKPQPNTVSARCSELMFPSEHGARVLSFSSPEPLPNPVASSSWARVAKTEANMVVYTGEPHMNYMERQSSFLEGSSHSSSGFKGANQLQFLQSTHQQSIVSQNIYSDGLNQVVDSDRALSLLSSAPALSREFGSGHHVAQPDPPVVPHVQYIGLGQGQYTYDPRNVESRPVEFGMDSHGSKSSTLNFPGMFMNEPDGPSTSGSHQTRPFTSGSHQTRTFTWE